MEVKYTEWNCSSCWKFRNERECVPDQDPSTDSCLNHETSRSKAEMDKLREVVVSQQAIVRNATKQANEAREWAKTTSNSTSHTPYLTTRLFQIAVVVLLIGIASWPYIINNNIRGCEKQFSLLRSELVLAEARRDSLLVEGAFVWGVVLPGSVDVSKVHARHKVTKPTLRK